MADSAAPATKAPWHLWVVGVIAVLWNAMGVVDFTMTQLKNETWLKTFTPAQLEYIYGFPLWAVLGWGAGVWGGLTGSFLLLFRRGWAVRVFGVSVFGVILTVLYSYVITDSLKIMNGGAGSVIFSAVIFVIAVLLWWYAATLARRGVLR